VAMIGLCGRDMVFSPLGLVASAEVQAKSYFHFAAGGRASSNGLCFTHILFRGREVLV